MKKILFICLCLTASTSYAEVDVVPLDMELGYWETTTEIVESEAIKSMLANLPESQRDQVREMMKNKTQLSVVKQCITSDFFEDFEEKFKESMGAEKSCEFKVKKSTREEFVGELRCTGHTTEIHTKAVNSKRQISDVVSSMGGVGQNKIRIIAQWKSSICPDGVTP